MSSHGRVTDVRPGSAPTGRALHSDTDLASRRAKAGKIASILADVWPDQLAQSRCLDLGCGIGVIAGHLAEVAHRVIALEPEWSLISQAPAALSRLQGDGLQLPFPDGAFDLVVCAQVYEHVADPTRLVGEIARVLRPGGICYFSGPNRLWPYEYHYQTWFVHWLPRKWHHQVLQLLGNSRPPDLVLLHYWELCQLWRLFVLRDYTPDLVRHPDRFPGANAPHWMRHLPLSILGLVAFLSPNVNWVLSKPLPNEEGSYENHRN